jgi:uncharacterized protein YdaU (DUF1376 family)
MATKKKYNVWMPLYVADYIADTMHLTTEQHGAYLLLLMSAWKCDGKLPNDPAQLQQIARMTPQQWARSERVLQGFFFVTEDFWLHNRVRKELDRAKDKVDKKASAGTVGAAAKWGLDEYVAAADGESHRETRSRRLARARSIGSHTKDEWDALLDVCGQFCPRCKSADNPGPCKDHIKPIYQGGSDSIENVQPLCRTCNSSKGSEAVDYRPPDWRERLTKRLAERLANARQDA